MLDNLLGHGEVGEDVADHFWLDLNFNKFLAVVDADHVIDEFWEDDHSPKVGLDNWWLDTSLALDGVTSSLELLDELDMLQSEGTLDEAAAPRIKELDEFWDFQSLKVIEGLATESVVTLCELRHDERPWPVKTTFLPQ